MESIRSKIKTIVESIVPYDDIERADQEFALQWIDSDAGLFRIQKPASPRLHLVSYFLYVLSSFTVHHLVKATKLNLFRRIHRCLKDRGAYLELDGVASPNQEIASFQEFEKHIAHLDGAHLGDWNHDLCLTIPNEMSLLQEAGFTKVLVPWQETDATGSGRAIFIARK